MLRERDQNVWYLKARAWGPPPSSSIEEATCPRCFWLRWASPVVGVFLIVAWVLIALGIMSILGAARAQSGSPLSNDEYVRQAQERLKYEQQFIPSREHPYLVKMPDGDIDTVYPQGWYQSPLGYQLREQQMPSQTNCWWIGQTWSCR